MRPAVFRWPGGCFADTYHWEDGVGRQDQRIPRRNHWWLREEPNTFGTDEFIRWCAILKAQPYLSVNVGSGSVREALDWLEYCNSDSAIGFAARRRQNGYPEPHKVRWWGIGNENWGCGGTLTAAEYAQQFRQYAVFFKRLGMSEDLQLVGVGHTAGDWNPKFLAALGPGLPYLDHLSFHQYFRHGHSTEFTPQEYNSMMLELGDFERNITSAIRAIEEVEPARARIPLFGGLKPKPIGLVIDEWGVWHKDSPFADGFSQKGILRDAVFAASALNLFHRYARRITMTNIAQVMNCLHSLILTAGPSMVLTPTFHVYEMYQPHYDATAVEVELEAAPLLGSGSRTRPALSVSASKSSGSMLVTLVNQQPNQAVDVALRLEGGRAAGAKSTILSGPSARAQNTFDQPDLVAPKPAPVSLVDRGIRPTVPPHSVQAVQVRLG